MIRHLKDIFENDRLELFLNTFRNKARFLPYLGLIYDIIGKIRPATIIDFGARFGCSGTIMAYALQDYNIPGHIFSYDIWKDTFSGWRDESSKNLQRECWQSFIDCGVDKYITLEHLDFNDWILRPKEGRNFDLMYVDIMNDGDKIELLYESTKEEIESGKVILFEGGSEIRDQVPWMKELTPIQSIKEKTGYKTIHDDGTRLVLSSLCNFDILEGI